MSKAAEGTVSMTAGGMVTKTAKDKMNKKAGINRTNIDMTTAEILTVLVKAMTNRDPMSECKEGGWTRRDTCDIKNDCPARKAE